MKTTRRTFVRSLGLGTAAGLLGATPLISAVSVPAAAQTREARRLGVFDGGVMQLHQNESARGPGSRTLEAIREYTSKRLGRGYPPDHVNELRAAIAARHDLEDEQVLLASGSTYLLLGASRAFCSPEKPLVTAAPTFSTSEVAARDVNAPIEKHALDAEGRLDLDAMAASVARLQAGLVYVCNPNNPSGTVHSPAVIESFARRVMAESPGTYILVDEAYIEYADPAVMGTAVPLIKESDRVIITRSFSKAHGMAGMRVGFAMGRQETLQAIGNAWAMGDVAMLSALAALTSFEDTEHMAWERQENAAIREFTVNAFAELGYDTPVSQTNHIFVNLRQPAAQFREACLEEKIMVGRDFPPLENSHCRISLGSREEMEAAVRIFRKILG